MFQKMFSNSLDYAIETNIKDKALDAIKKLFLMTGKHHILPRDYVDSAKSADTTFISQSKNISEHILKEFLTNKGEVEEDYNEEKNVITKKIIFEDYYSFKQNLLVIENFSLYKESGFINEFLKFKSKYKDYYINVKALKQNTIDSYFKK